MALVGGRTRTLNLVIVPEPSSDASRTRMTGFDRSISRRQLTFATSTLRTFAPANCTLLARASDGPTAVRQANVTLPSESGMFLSRLATAAGSAS